MTNSGTRLDAPRSTSTSTELDSTDPTVSATAQINSAHTRAWGFLLAAAVFEVAFALGIKGSEGFTQLGWTLWTVVAALCAIFLLSQALTTLDVGIAYTVWTGIGSIGTVVFGTFLFDESMTVLKALSFLAIIGGVLGLKLSSKPDAPDLEVATA